MERIHSGVSFKLFPQASKVNFVGPSTLFRRKITEDPIRNIEAVKFAFDKTRMALENDEPLGDFFSFYSSRRELKNNDRIIEDGAKTQIPSCSLDRSKAPSKQ